MKHHRIEHRADVNSEEETYELTEADRDIIRCTIKDGTLDLGQYPTTLRLVELEELERTLRLELVEFYGFVRGRGLARGRHLERLARRISAMLLELRRREGQAPV